MRISFLYFFLEKLYKHANVEIKTSDGESKTDESPPKGYNVFDLLKAGIESCLKCASSSSSTLDPLIDHRRQEAANNQSEDDDTFRKLTMTFFEGAFVTTADEIKEIEHFTDLIRKSWLPKDLNEKKEYDNEAPIVNLLYSATRLDKAGLNFVPAASKDGLASVKMTTGPCYKYFPFCRSRRQLELSQITR